VVGGHRPLFDAHLDFRHKPCFQVRLCARGPTHTQAWSACGDTHTAHGTHTCPRPLPIISVNCVNSSVYTSLFSSVSSNRSGCGCVVCVGWQPGKQQVWAYQEARRPRGTNTYGSAPCRTARAGLERRPP
jgi:hypothetical protein